MKKLLIIDLESTCHERGREPSGFFSEIIEIGAVLLNPETLSNEWEFQALLGPVLFPKLSDFCKRLTSIRQDEVDSGLTLQKALNALKEKCGGESYRFASWGFYDRNQFQKNCERFGLSYPFPSDHFSLKHEFGRWMKRPPMGMEAALKLLNLALDGTHHRGLDDARNISKIAVWMLKQGWQFS